MIGLLEYWDLTQDPEALRSATRLGNFYLSDFPREKPGLDSWKRDVYPNMNHIGGHVEGLVALWRATRNIDYLNLAGKVLSTVAPEFGEPDGKEHGHHTHAFLMDTRGCVDLHLATGKDEYLRHARRVWDFILQRCMWVSGGISEVSTFPFETRDEACSVADWLRLSLSLWRVTRDSRYMDLAEHTLLNHLYFDQDHSGGFCSYRSIGEDNTGQGRDHVAYLCCSMHGLRGLLEAVRFIYTHDDDGVDVNLFGVIDLTNPTMPRHGSTNHDSITSISPILPSNCTRYH